MAKNGRKLNYQPVFSPGKPVAQRRHPQLNAPAQAVMLERTSAGTSALALLAYLPKSQKISSRHAIAAQLLNWLKTTQTYVSSTRCFNQFQLNTASFDLHTSI